MNFETDHMCAMTTIAANQPCALHKNDGQSPIPLSDMLYDPVTIHVLQTPSVVDVIYADSL